MEQLVEDLKVIIHLCKEVKVFLLEVSILNKGGN